ncbi:MAG: type I restriction endonuclease [Erysipelotrichaceae bacterium]|nr:type I restriction endonuclease [Erysipelotrichaceae bacterium]
MYVDNKTVYESAKILRDKYILQLDNGETVYLDFFTSDSTRNTYQVTHQVTMDPDHKDDVLYKNRYDVTILINGLPLVQTELKRPGIEINEAINQINRYRRFSFRGLFRYIQLFVVSNSTMTKYCANINENDVFGHKQDILKSLTFFWTDEANVRINKLMDFTNAFLPKFTLTEMLTKYFVIKDTEPVLLVMRPYQIYAVKRAFDRIIMANMNGYVFHTTGSGKTLTSFKLASLLRDDRRIDKVFFLVDRSDLDDQTIDEDNSFEAGCVDQTDNTYNLVKSLEDPTKTHWRRRSFGNRS